MPDLFEGKSTELNTLEFIEKVRNVAKVIWLGRIIGYDDYNRSVGIVTVDDLFSLFQITDTKTKKYSINTVEEWKQFSNSSCYVVRYKDNKGWTDKKAELYSLKEWAADKRSDPKFTREKKNNYVKEFTTNVIIACVDTRKQKRLIVDGVHRTTILTNESDNIGSTASPAEIWECYGAKVDVIFPCDIIHL